MMDLSKAQIEFLEFSQTRTLYGFNNTVNHAVPRLRGATALCVVVSLRNRGFITADGLISATGREELLKASRA